MEKSISLDIAALVLLMILIVSRISRKMTHDRSNRIFLFTLLTAFVSAVCDMMSVLLERGQNAPESLLYVVNAGYLITHYLTVPLYFLFVISLTDTWHKIMKNKVRQILLGLPILVVLAAIVMNAGNHFIFTVERGYYERGPLFGVLYVTAILYVVFDIVYIIQYRKLFSIGKIFSFSAVIPINVAALLIQYVYPDALIEMFCGAVGLLIMSIGLQRAEDYVDTFTHLMKHSAYVHDMKRSFSNEKHVYIIMLNISNFQRIQTIVGFDSAREALEIVGDEIRRINRKLHGAADLYYLDNGRFRMVFRENKEKQAEAVAEALNQELKDQISFKGLNISFISYIMLARCPEEIKDFKTLMTFGAEFHLKNHYTGQVMYAGRLYDLNQLGIQNNIDTIIEKALKNDSFEVYYQPIYSTQQERFVSSEALLRLIDDEYGFISPELLVTAAEKSGTIHQIGELVFEKVCRFIASDEFAGLGLDYIEVNLSVAQLMKEDLPDTLLAIMERYGVTPAQINLEVTESATSYQQEVMFENFERLSQAGLSFSLDDYGTGYSNIKRMIELPLKIIKLDKSFADEKNNPKMLVVIENTVKMLKDMNMEVVVEGVETQETLDLFSRLKCDFIQGYFFSKPIPQKDFVAFISKGNASPQ